MTALSQKISLSVQSSCCYRLTPKISAPFRRSGSFPSLIFERALTPARLCGHLGVTHRNSLSKRAKATIVMVLTESKTMEIGTRAPPFQVDMFAFRINWIWQQTKFYSQSNGVYCRSSLCASFSRKCTRRRAVCFSSSGSACSST